MDGAYPSDAQYKMRIEYKRTRVSFEDAEDKLKYCQELLTFLYLATTNNIHQLQMGFTTQETNGISFNFDKQSVDDFRKQIQILLNTNASGFQVLEMEDVTQRNSYAPKGNNNYY